MTKLLGQAKFLARRFGLLNMDRALDLLYLLDCYQDIVYFHNQATTIGDVCCSVYSKHHAKSVEGIWFEGGPPGVTEWHCGTLYQVIIDRLMRELALAERHRDVIRKLKLRKKQNA